MSALYVLNFYSPVFVDQLKRGRKTATIRLGDKTRKYDRGQVVCAVLEAVAPGPAQPVTVSALVWLFRRFPDDYPLWRNTLLVVADRLRAYSIGGAGFALGPF